MSFKDISYLQLEWTSCLAEWNLAGGIMRNISLIYFFKFEQVAHEMSFQYTLI